MKKMVLHSVVIFMLTGLCVLGVSELFSASENILARVGDKVITQEDLNALAKQYEPKRKGSPYSPEEKKDLLNKLINTNLICMEAEREKFDQRSEFQLKLKLLKQELLSREYITTIIEPLVVVKDGEVDEILRQNPNLLQREMLTLKEILVKTEKEAGEIFQALKEGADFTKMVGEKSISPTKTKGGLVGTVSRGQLPPDFEAVVFDLKEGEFSKPIRTEDGYRILFLVSKKVRSLEEVRVIEARVREKILQLERGKRIDAILERKVEALKKQIKVETYLDRLK